MPEKDHYLYIISLNRLRLLILSISLIVLFSLFFVLGITIGIHSQNENRFDQTAQVNPDSMNAIDSMETIEKEIQSATEQTVEIPLKNRKSSPAYRNNQPEASSLSLLKQDQNAQNVSEEHRYKIRKETKAHSHRKTTSKYYIQILATYNQKKAIELRKELLVRKYKGYINKKRSNGKTLWLVRVGLYENFDFAKRHLNILRDKGGFHTAFIINHNSGKRIRISQG